MKRKMVKGDEYDAFTGWRHVIAWRAGQRRAIKQRVNRRERREARSDLYRNLDNG